MGIISLGSIGGSLAAQALGKSFRVMLFWPLQLTGISRVSLAFDAIVLAPDAV